MSGKVSKMRLSSYAAKAMTITGCSELEATVVEEIMRNNIFHSTLDWQTSEEYRTAALMAYETLKEMRDSGTLPESYQRLLEGRNVCG
jgi:hypothetical protein